MSSSEINSLMQDAVLTNFIYFVHSKSSQHEYKAPPDLSFNWKPHEVSQRDKNSVSDVVSKIKLDSAL